MLFASRRVMMMVLSLLVLAAGLVPEFSLQASEQKKFRVGVELLSYFPAYNFSTKGPGDSASYAILEKFARSEHIVFEYVPLPVNRLYRDFLDKSLDFKFPDNPKWRNDLKGEQKVFYSESVFEYIDGMMVIPGHVNAGKDKIKKVGSVLGFTVWDYLTDIQKGSMAVSEYPDFGELLRAGVKGLVDGVYINIAVGNYHLDENLKQPKGLVFDPSLPHTRDSYRLSTLKHSALLDRFSSYLKSHVRDLDIIRNKYKVDIR